MNDVTKDLLEALRFLLSAHGEQLDLAFAQAHDAIARAEAEAQQERLLQDMHDAGREIDRVMAEPAPKEPVAEPVNVDFGKRGENMFFKIDNQSFLLDYKPEEQGEFEFMKAMLLSAFSRITHGVKTESQPVNARILDVSTGKLEHINAGLCPDSINGPDSRDPACPACRAIAEADADLKLENILHKFGEADFPPGYCLDPMCSREEMEAQQEKPKD